MEIDRKELIASLGGEAAVKSMDHEARADALEDFLSARLDAVVAARPAAKSYPTVAEHASRVDKRGYRRGVGRLFLHEHSNKNPDADESKLHRAAPAADAGQADLGRLLQVSLRAGGASAAERGARQTARCLGGDHPRLPAARCRPGPDEDRSRLVGRPDHRALCVRARDLRGQVSSGLRFYPDPSVGYEYPESYYQTFGIDYVPLPHIKAAYEYARNHKWYMDARLVTLNDLYAFDPNVQVSVDEFTDIIGRHFRQPAEGLGYDDTPVSHMWRTMINPDAPL